MQASNHYKINATIYTNKASVYLNKLCRHFSHKVPMELEGDVGYLHFSIGQCRIQVNNNELSICCESPDQEQLYELKDVIKSHFDRFAQKDLLTLQWAE